MHTFIVYLMRYKTVCGRQQVLSKNKSYFMKNASFSFGGPIPELYDRYLGPYIFEPYAKDIAARIKLPVKQVLEVAAGTGRVTHHIAGCIGKDARLTATDINADMLAVARQRVNAPHIEWMTANAMELPFDDNYFDCVVCQFGYMFLNDRQKGFDEALRVLKPGGQFLFSTWDKVENNITAYISRQIVTAFFKDDRSAGILQSSFLHVRSCRTGSAPGCCRVWQSYGTACKLYGRE